MDREIGGQGMELGMLKEKVVGLEDKRGKIDRPDLDSLKSSREHVLWTSSITVFVTLAAILGTSAITKIT